MICGWIYVYYLGFCTLFILSVLYFLKNFKWRFLLFCFISSIVLLTIHLKYFRVCNMHHITVHLQIVLCHFIHNVKEVFSFPFSYNRLNFYDCYKLCYIVFGFALNNLLSFKEIKKQKCLFYPLFTISDTSFLGVDSSFYLLSFFFTQSTSFKVSWCSSTDNDFPQLSMSLNFFILSFLLKDTFIWHRFPGLQSLSFCILYIYFH